MPKREIRCDFPKQHKDRPLVCPACSAMKGGASRSAAKLAALAHTRSKRWPKAASKRRGTDSSTNGTTTKGGTRASGKG